MTIYSNYLDEVGKLVFIIGQIQATSSFKKMLDSNNDENNRSKIFLKCVDEMPVGTYKKIKYQCRRKGILRCDWFNKITNKSPMMIFMVFNYCQPLDANEKWQDRLSLTLRKINKVYDVLRQSNKQQIILRIIIIISKQSVLLQSSQTAGNIVQKITTFLKNYQKELNIFQSDQLTKDINRNKTFWWTMLDKAYERKYRAINKRKEECFSQRRLGCLVKMAVISQIISKQDSYAQYDEAYRSLHFRFNQLMKNKIQFYNFDAIREVRTLADIVILRRLIVKMAISKNFQNASETISNHLKYFYQAPHKDHIFYLYQNILWRQNFLQNLLQVLYKNDHIQVIPKSFFAQLINSTVSLSYKLCRAPKQILLTLQNLQIKGRIIPTQNSIYIGSRNYTIGLQITDLDVIWTQLNQLAQRKKDFITRGMQTIVRYKGMKLFKKHQTNFFNIYLLRFYLADEKFISIGNIFNQIIRLKISQYDFYSLNFLIDELEKQTQKTQQHMMLIHSLAVLISDYFKNKQELEKYGHKLMAILPNKTISKAENVDLLNDFTEFNNITSDPQKQPLILPLLSQSLVFSLQVIFPDKLHMIQKQLQIHMKPKFDNKFLVNSNKKIKLKLFFNKSQIQYQSQIKLSDFQSDNKIIVKINPLQYFSKDQVLELKTAVLITLTNPQLHFFIENIYFPKYKSVILITKLIPPEISIDLPYENFYFNQTSKFKITVNQSNIRNSSTNIQMLQFQTSTKTQVSFSITQQPVSNNTQIYTELSQRLNIINSNCFQHLSSRQPNILYLKCNKMGSKIIKFVFNITVTQHIGDKQLKDYYTFSKQIGFKVLNLFKTSKLMKQVQTGADLKFHEIPANRGIIMSYHVKAVDKVHIIQLGQHTSPKPYFKTHKNISPVFNYTISPDQRLKNIYMFQVLEQQLKNQENKELFLISFYIKWCRTDMDAKLGLLQPPQSIIITNVYNQDDVKISLKNDKVSVEYQEGKTLTKRKKQTLSIKYRNLTSEPIHVYSMMDNSQQILRIGNRGSQVKLNPKETKTMIFQILPVKSGYFKYPLVRSFFDGIQAKEKVCNSIICVI